MKFKEITMKNMLIAIFCLAIVALGQEQLDSTKQEFEIEVDDTLSPKFSYSVFALTSTITPIISNHRTEGDLVFGAGAKIGYSPTSKISLVAEYMYNFVTINKYQKAYSQKLELGTKLVFFEGLKQTKKSVTYQKLEHTANAFLIQYLYSTQRFIGARAGFLVQNIPISYKNGVDNYIHGTHPAGYEIELRENLTNNSHKYVKEWTMENTLNGYLGLSVLMRQSPLIKFDEIENSKVQASYYKNIEVYIDLMFCAYKSIRELSYLHNKYAFNYGDQPGQIPAADWGFRIGSDYFNSKRFSFPFGAEIAIFPGKKNIYHELKIGLGGVL
ncbi:MAG: hypothetical protein GX801_04425 [Fibrobacter sp.]|nr:hypothetical protein [Fibrobacter sp.]